MSKKIILFALIALLSANALAIGITPGRAVLNFEPNGEKTGIVSVINSEEKEASVSVAVGGELKEFISVSESSFKLNPGGEKKITYNLKMPYKLAPGVHSAKIVAVQTADMSGGGSTFVGSAAGVVSEVSVFVPYPNKYIESSLNIDGPDSNNNIAFVIPVVNRGSVGVEKASAEITITDSAGRRISIVKTNELSVPALERKELFGQLNSANMPFGNYSAIAVVSYDENVLTLQKSFSIGEPIVEVESIKVGDFKLGEIAKFDLAVKNNWNEPINGFYLQMIISNPNGGGIEGNFRSINYDLPPVSRTIVNAFWDTAGIAKGIYEASLVMNYGSKSLEKKYKLDVKDDSIDVAAIGYVITAKSKEGGVSNSVIIVLVTIIAVLVIANILWFLVLRKKMKSRAKAYGLLILPAAALALRVFG
jgi:hypothetical protein